MDQFFDLAPEVGIALALHVSRNKDPLEPGSAFALDWGFSVIKKIVAEDVGSGGISGRDLGPAADDAVRLIEICCGHDVVGNDAVFLPEFGDAVDLDGQQDGDSGTVQLAGQQHGG